MDMAIFDVFTIGFSNRSWDETLMIFEAFGIRRLLDIRTLPGSKHTPQFNQEQLASALPPSNIEYLHLKRLGGLRKPRVGSSANSGWKNAGFRGYADYMQTVQFVEALNELTQLFSEKRSVYACTEAVFWRCHRALVSDALAVRGFKVGHIFSRTKCAPHRVTDFARVEGHRITYPSPQDTFL